jgi:antitoxin component YwqK of YwqJK toxin-antitoxin module
MKFRLSLLCGALALLASSCHKDNNNSQVVSQRYVHKYGYAVSQEEWASKNYPGQVITALRSGVVVTATYENHELHGPCTYTYPNSQTVERYVLYNRGQTAKEVLYDMSGMPMKETVQLSPSRHSLTLWYADGAPRSVEEFANDELLEGQYFSVLNEVQSRVEKGHGERTMRDAKGTLLYRDEIDKGFTVKRDSFYANGSPESVTYYLNNQMHGEKTTFTANGEPLAVEEWVNGQLHGKSTYFKNGTKYLEISYLFGKKNGLETYFVDGDKVSHQIVWENDRKHGPEVYYVDSAEKTAWFYAGKEVSKSNYDEQIRLDEIVSLVRPESNYR